MHGQADYVLIDTQDNGIIASEKMSRDECAKRNDEARSVGEFFLQWLPAHSFISLEHNVELSGPALFAGSAEVSCYANY